MTQEQCLDNGHRAESNNNSSNDQIGDDSNIFINSVVGGEVNSVQELNVDVNNKRSEHSANVLAVENFGVDNASPPTGKVLATTDRSAGTSINLVDSKENWKLFSSVDVKNDNSVNNSVSNMTVITHQSSSENIREIIGNSDKISKLPSDSQLTFVEDNGNNDSGLKISDKLKRDKSESKSSSDTDKPEDPIERLNKLRASISNALSEVKGVLKQYSTEQNDDENESSKSAENGPVRFRFVRKIRRRSVFSEDDEVLIQPTNENPQAIKSISNPITEDMVRNEKPTNDERIEKSENDQSISLIYKQKFSNEAISTAKDLTAISSEVNQNVKTAAKIEDTVKFDDATQQHIDCKKNQKRNLNIANNKKFSTLELKNQNSSSNPSKQNNATNDNSELESKNNAKGLVNVKETECVIEINTDDNEVKNSSSTKSTPVKLKMIKGKKTIKKDRRASIAAVEANQVLTDKISSQVELKTQRRPSDSGTLVKTPAQIISKLSEKAITCSPQIKSAFVSKSNVRQATHVTPASIQPNQAINEKEATTITKTTGASQQMTSTVEISTAAVKNEIAIDSETDNLTNLSVSYDQSKYFIEATIPKINKSQLENSKGKLVVESISKNNSGSHIEEVKINTPSLPEESKVEQSMGEISDTLNTSFAETEAVSRSTDFVDTGEKNHEAEKDNVAENQTNKHENILANIEQPTPKVEDAPAKKKRKAKRKVVIRRIKRKLSKEDTFIQIQDVPSELEICEKEIEEKDLDEEPEEEAAIVPQHPKSCLKAREFQIGDVVMYAERFKKTQVKWRKAKVTERITSISYKLDIDGEEKPAHISYIKKFTDRKVNFGGKEYLEIDYAQIEEDEEKERNYSIWNLV